MKLELVPDESGNEDITNTTPEKLSRSWSEPPRVSNRALDWGWKAGKAIGKTWTTAAKYRITEAIAASAIILDIIKVGYPSLYGSKHSHYNMGTAARVYSRVSEVREKCQDTFGMFQEPWPAIIVHTIFRQLHSPAFWSLFCPRPILVQPSHIHLCLHPRLRQLLVVQWNQTPDHVLVVWRGFSGLVIQLLRTVQGSWSNTYCSRSVYQARLGW